MDRIEVDALEDCNVDSESSSDSELDDLILRMHRKEVCYKFIFVLFVPFILMISFLFSRLFMRLKGI